jgi:hypothetical protein
MDNHQERSAKVVGEILSLHSRVERTINRLTTKLNEVSEPLDDSNVYASPDYWRLRAVSDGMAKIHLIIQQNFHYIETFGVLACSRYILELQQNFHYIETFGVLACSRYILELLIWFRLLREPQHCFTYARQLLTDQLDHLDKQLQKVKREIKLFNELEERELGYTVEAVRSRLRSELSPSHSMIAEEIDRIARRHFCVYNNDAKTRGYGFQASLMEQQVIPQLKKEIEHRQQISANAISQMPKSAQKDKRPNWKERAKAVGMIEQYEFVYAFTSRLLHATPTSMTTGQQNLELDEFINRYISK